jgi:hypothetical protein
LSGKKEKCQCFREQAKEGSFVTRVRYLANPLPRRIGLRSGENTVPVGSSPLARNTNMKVVSSKRCCSGATDRCNNALSTIGPASPDDNQDTDRGDIEDDPEDHIGAIMMECDYKHARMYGSISSLARSRKRKT